MKHLTDYKSRFRILKGGKISLMVSAVLGSMTILSASPSGGTVTSGSATIAQNGTTTNITQSTSKASINWQKFNIASNETVNFKQPSTSSITLNRVIGNEKSVINGAMNANGQVWLLNSNGVLFGKNASINTAGLLATTAQLSDTDFQNGNYAFKNSTSNSVINEGTITISDGGSVILASNEVRNSGTIKAIKGKVHLTGATDYTINLNGNSLVNLKVDKGVLDAMVENSGTILVDGGEIYLTTNAVDELLKGVVNNIGIIEANSLDGLTGYVELFAHGGTAQIGGKVNAKDGFVETSGRYFDFLDADIQAGEWLIDPVDITIDDALATAIENALVNGDVYVDTANAGASNVDTTGKETSNDGDITDGDIYVESDITWASEHVLELSADDEIYVNAVIENTNATNGGVIFDAANDNSKVIFGANGKVIIHNPFQLQWMITAKNGKYELGSTINAQSTSTWNGGAGFEPIGSNYVTRFDGTFDGKGYEIAFFNINRPSTNFVGLFGYAGSNAEISNVTFTAADVTGQDLVGIVVGSGSPDVDTVQVAGNVSGRSYVGGMFGSTGSENTLTTVRSDATVTGTGDGIGGLAGLILAEGGSGTISKAYANGDVSGVNKVGGLFGIVSAISLTADQLYARGNVSGENAVGGLIGHMSYGTSTISNSYARGGNVIATSDTAGGLIGGMDALTVTIENSYSSGAVSASVNDGGLVGAINLGDGDSVTINNSFWDMETSGQSSSAGGTGVTTAELKSYDFLNAAGWDIRGDDRWGGYYSNLTWDDSDSVWVIGTQGTSAPTPDPTPPTPSTPTTDEPVADIITPILNGTRTAVTVPQVIVPQAVNPAPRLQTQRTMATNMGLRNARIVSRANTGEKASQVVSLGELQQANGAGKVVRVPLSKNSSLDLVNGGVNLPDGVEQQFFVVADENKGAN